MLGGSPLPAIAFDVPQVSDVERRDASSGLHVSEWLEIRYRRSPAEASLRSVVRLVGSPAQPSSDPTDNRGCSAKLGSSGSCLRLGLICALAVSQGSRG